MPRLAPLFVVAACSQSATPPAPPAPPTAPVGFPSEKPALADDALAVIPAHADAVAVARSLDDLEARLGPASAMFTTATGIALPFSRTKPIGIALVGDGWIAFGTIDNRRELESSVPAERRKMHDQLAFVADSAETLATIDRSDGLAQDKRFRATLAELHFGALVSAWRADEGAIGIAADGATLRVRAVGVARADKSDPAAARAAALRDARRFGMIGGISKFGAPKALRDRYDAAVKARDAARDELATVRARVAADLAAQVGIAGTRPVERTFTVPAATVGAWLAPALAKWNAPEPIAKVAALDAQIAELDRKMAKASASAFGTIGLRSDVEALRMEADAQRMADLLTGPAEPELASGVMSRRVPNADLGQQISDVRAVGGGRGGGGGGGGRGMGMGSIGTRRSPRVEISGSGDAQLRAHLTSRLSRVRTCYDRALETTPGLEASIRITLTADADGGVQASAAGASDATLASCVEVAARGTGVAAHGVSATFTLELTPP